MPCPGCDRAILETIRDNDLEACFVRPLVFSGEDAMGIYAPDH
jgi:hypothetical protein